MPRAKKRAADKDVSYDPILGPEASAKYWGVSRSQFLADPPKDWTLLPSRGKKRLRRGWHVSVLNAELKRRDAEARRDAGLPQAEPLEEAHVRDRRTSLGLRRPF